MAPDQYLPIVVAFCLGYLARVALSSSEFSQLRWRIASCLPRRCPSCGAWRQKRNMHPAKHKVAGWIRLCDDCYNEQYSPSKTKGNLS